MEWLNQVDLAFKTDLHQVNEQNFFRFEAKLEQRLAELRDELLAEMHRLQAELIKWMFLFWAGTALAGLLLR